MADVKNFLHSLTRPRRMGALSGNTTGIKGTSGPATGSDSADDESIGNESTGDASTGNASAGADSDASTSEAQATTPKAKSSRRGRSTKTAGAKTSAAKPAPYEAGADEDYYGDPADLPLKYLPGKGELKQSEDAVAVDRSELVLEHIDLDSWKQPEYFAFSLTRMEELFPSAGISRGIGPVRKFTSEYIDAHPLGVDHDRWWAVDKSWTTVGDVLDNTHTDAWMVVRNGIALVEEYSWPMKPARRHMLFSISKSIVSTVIGGLDDAGLLSPDDLVTTHLPALAKSGYVGATIRHLLDMRSGIKFSEEYLQEGSEIRALFEAVDFAPRSATSARGIKAFLSGLTADRSHGDAFIYRSCETDVLAWIAEEITGQPFAVLASQYVWSKIGAAHAAQVCQDRWGGSIADGAISTTVRDLARFGEMIARGGTTANGERVLSRTWIDDIFSGAADSDEIFAASVSGTSYPGGMYRSQFWAPSDNRDVVMGLGIHGQMLYIDRDTQTVGVKLSSDPAPVSLAAQHGTLAIFEAVSAAVPVDHEPTKIPVPFGEVPAASSQTQPSAEVAADSAAASTSAGVSAGVAKLPAAGVDFPAAGADFAPVPFPPVVPLAVAGGY